MNCVTLLEQQVIFSSFPDDNIEDCFKLNVSLKIHIRQILDSIKLKKFADKNFKFDENGGQVSKTEENSGKSRNCSLQALSPFPTAFSKDLNCRQVKTRACLGKA